MLTTSAPRPATCVPAAPSTPYPVAAALDDDAARAKFDQFVGQTFYGQLISAMRQTVDKPAYFHGGRAEEIFRGQLDQLLADDLTERTAGEFTGPMYDLFRQSRP